MLGFLDFLHALTYDVNIRSEIAEDVNICDEYTQSFWSRKWNFVNFKITTMFNANIVIKTGDIA